MRNRIIGFCLLLLSGGWMMTSCTTEFEVYAPEKEIRSVYGVLNPNDSVQYIRIARAYQVEGDAIVYAGVNDLSVKALDVRLTGAGVTYQAEQVDSFVKDSGIFTPYHTVYRIITDGSGAGKEALVPGERYTLEVGSSDAPDYVRAETDIPAAPDIRGSLSLINQGANEKCLPVASLSNDYEMLFRKGGGAAWELRVYLTVSIDGVEQTFRWGPTEPIENSVRCPGSGSELCYHWNEKDIIRPFLRYLDDPGNHSYVYDDIPQCADNSQLDLLPTSLCFEVTNMDASLRDYIYVNNPALPDLTGAKPEYTNIGGNIEAVGIFGSINMDRAYARLNECSMALLNLNGVALPNGCSWDEE